MGLLRLEECNSRVHYGAPKWCLLQRYYLYKTITQQWVGTFVFSLLVSLFQETKRKESKWDWLAGRPAHRRAVRALMMTLLRRQHGAKQLGLGHLSLSPPPISPPSLSLSFLFLDERKGNQNHLEKLLSIVEKMFRSVLLCVIFLFRLYFILKHRLLNYSAGWCPGISVGLKRRQRAFLSPPSK